MFVQEMSLIKSYLRATEERLTNPAIHSIATEVVSSINHGEALKAFAAIKAGKVLF